MTKTRLLRDALGWGLALWFIGYVLGVILLFALPVTLIGWVITPVGTALTLWVLLRQIGGGAFMHYLLIAVVWTAIAVLFDYLFIVRAFSPPDGYYKPDVYLYYALTFLLPLAIGVRQMNARPARAG